MIVFLIVQPTPSCGVGLSRSKYPACIKIRRKKDSSHVSFAHELKGNRAFMLHLHPILERSSRVCNLEDLGCVHVSLRYSNKCLN
ncbi:hypothetical protein AAC387_Pa04g2706 [Persea americana]